jgi:hypothetical protein
MSLRDAGAANVPAVRCCAVKPHARRCSNGWTPLKWAIECKKSDAAAFLRSAGAPE